MRRALFTVVEALVSNALSQRGKDVRYNVAPRGGKQRDHRRGFWLGVSGQTR
ncbi:hypothetical protein AWB64_05471 [Caballeronia sordidicola]|uniref:Uncharacterized protein n=1 Tax=Caballeronia sordidicola TaxID=196367 RepID=A0A158I3W7_CABSO|nr:hypothetical protein AWB64_05471 [Caballeronia sordidicola]